jgi:hypothetical protein
MKIKTPADSENSLFHNNIILTTMLSNSKTLVEKTTICEK